MLVWAFGGGLTSGSGRTFNGTRLAALGQMVVVSINYRLGVLGLYASHELVEEEKSTGGLNSAHDILHALRFVHTHVRSFGGDPSRVALGGESSGSVSSCLLAFTPHAKGLFHRLFLESGACTGPWMGVNPSAAASFAASAAFAADVGCGNAANRTHARLVCLRGLPAQTLVSSSKWDSLNFGLDGDLLTQAPVNSTLHYNGPLLIGGNSEDTTCFQSTDPPTPTTLDELRESLAGYFEDDAEDVLAPYLPRDPAARDLNAGALWLNMSRDAGVSCPTLQLARRFVAQASPVYVYSFEFNATRPGAGVLHGDEVDLVWQRPPPNSVAAAHDVARHVGEYWSSFVAHGAPRTMPSDTWPLWPAFNSTTSGTPARPDDRYLAFVAAGHAASSERFYAAKCEAWEAYRARGPLQRQRYIAFGYLC